MNNLEKAFAGGKAFIPFITAGDPNLAVTEMLVPAMAAAGADLIELGIPFSDPVAEGPVIQQADERALSAGATTDKIFESVRRIRVQCNVPIAFMTYMNPVFRYGAERFLKNCADCGVDALIVPDLPFEEKNDLLPVCRANQVTLISMISPASHERVRKIAQEAEGFLYCVSSMGVTGVRETLSADVGGMIKAAKEVSRIPCAVGFGISKPEQAKQMGALSDGVIVGSAIVKLIAQYGENCIEPVSAYVKQMKAALG